MIPALYWITKIPENWKILPLKAVANYQISSVDKNKNEDESPVKLCNYIDVYKNEFISSDLDFMEGTASLDEIQKFKLFSGDVIITKDSESWDDIGIPALVAEDIQDLICGYHLALIRPDSSKIFSRFLLYCLLAKAIRIQLELASTGVTRYGLPKDAIGKLFLPIPNLIIQKKIITFLDYETQRIDSLINAKVKLHYLLSEKRKALINQSVIKGLNPDAKLKDSGIGWLGQIPAHWEVERSKWLFTERNKRSEFGEEEMLSVSHITGVTPRSEKNVNMFEAETNEGYKICKAGDLVINTLWAWMGAMGIAPIDGIVSPAYHVYTPSDKICADYIDCIVRLPVFATEVTRFSKGVWSSRLRLYPEGFYEVYFPVPPIDEQMEIVKLMKQEIDNIDKLKEATLGSIELLKERRIALITEAVTGQLEIS